MKKYCWLNLATGEFSNSWSEESHKMEKDFWSEEYLTQSLENGYKLIEFTCLNDPEFEFMDKMKLK